MTSSSEFVNFRLGSIPYDRRIGLDAVELRLRRSGRIRSGGRRARGIDGVG